VTQSLWIGDGLLPDLLDLVFGAVAVTGDYGVLQGLVFLVLHLEGVAFVVDQFDLDVAIGSVIFVVGRTIGKDVLVADRVVDLREDVGQSSLEHRVEAQSSGHPGEGLHLVVGLEIVHAGDRSHTSAGVGQLTYKRSGPDGEDGDVLGGLDLSEDLIEREPGEGVAAGSDEDDVLASLDTTGSVERFVEGVEEVGIGEAGDDKRGERIADDLLVVGEVGQDVSAEIVGDDGYVVVRTQGVEEAEGRVLHVADEVVAVSGELKQHDRRDGGLGHADIGDLLGNSILEDEEVACLEAGHELMSFIENDIDVEVDDGNVDAKRVGFVIGILNLWLRRGYGRWRRCLLLLLFLDDQGAGVGLRTCGVVGRLLRRRSLLLRRLGECNGRNKTKAKEKGQQGRTVESQKRDHHLKLYSLLWTMRIGGSVTALLPVNSVKRVRIKASIRRKGYEPVLCWCCDGSGSSLVDVTKKRKTRLAFSLITAGLVAVCGFEASAQAVSSDAASAVSLPPTASAAMGGAAEAKIFPLAQLKRGMKGVAYTVFEGVNPEPMQVEILGVLKDSLGPGRDMILARLYGTKPEFTGVVAGMSGSPVYIEGRLVGALSYRIGQFSKEPIAGITPIEQMLEVRDDEVRPATVRGEKPGLTEAAGTTSLPAANAGTGVELQAMETPLVFSGFSQEAVDRFGDRFRAMGMTPVAGIGSADSKALQPEPLVPGSAVSAILVRGDLSIAGTCTVTYIDPTRLLACGHPITQYGPVDMPMTKAAVVATLPSPLNAFKIVNTTETVGAFTEDRASAIMGRFGTKARMIPVTVEVVQPPLPGGATSGTTGAKDKTFHFEVLDNRQLTPSAMLVSVYQSLQGTNAATAEMSYRLSGEIGVQGLPSVRMSGIIAQNELNPATINAALFINDRFSRVYGNPQDQPVVTDLKLKMVGTPERLTASLESARLGVLEARPGDTLDAEVTLRPYQAESRVVHLKVKLPDNLTPGNVRVLVSDGGTVDRLLGPSTPLRHAEGLADAVEQMNRLHSNDRVYVTLLSREAQAVLEGETLPGVPLSMANVLGPLKDSQRLHLNGESVVEAGSAEAGYAVSGSQVLNLTIR